MTTAFRLIVAIPILIVAGSIGGHEGAYGGGHGLRIAGGTAGLLFLAPLLMICVRVEKRDGVLASVPPIAG